MSKETSPPKERAESTAAGRNPSELAENASEDIARMVDAVKKGERGHRGSGASRSPQLRPASKGSTNVGGESGGGIDDDAFDAILNMKDEEMDELKQELKVLQCTSRFSL